MYIHVYIFFSFIMNYSAIQRGDYKNTDEIYLAQARDKDIRRVLTRLRTARSIDSHRLGIFNISNIFQIQAKGRG